jgi:hypothetical protein
MTRNALMHFVLHQTSDWLTNKSSKIFISLFRNFHFTNQEFDQMSDDSPSSSTAEPLNPKTCPGVVKHIYFDEEPDDTENSTAQKIIIERPTASTIRVDSSDLISRCKDFIPLLSDTNQNPSTLNENIPDEFNFPDIDNDLTSEKSSKESGEASSTTDDEKQIKKKRKKKKKKKKKKLKTNDDDNLNQDIHVNN